jgi:3-hydroxyisobutyrate dehydrogenase
VKPSTTVKTAVGFVGLGNMGSRMARHVTAAGYEVIGLDPHAGDVGDAVSRRTNSIKDLAADAGIILLSLPDSRVVESVVSGDDGIYTHARHGQVVVDLSTSSPQSTAKLAAGLAGHGVGYVDAGISGGAAAAEKGTLTLMLGGEPEPIDQVRPILQTFASRIFHMGPSSSGHTAKVLNNFLNAINLSASAEVLVAGKAAGLDMGKLLEVINASSGANWATQNRFPHIINGDYLEGGLTSRLMIKDLQLYVEHLRDVGAVSVHSAGPLAAFGLAVHNGYGDEISNRVVDALGDVSGGIRLADPPAA